MFKILVFLAIVEITVGKSLQDITNSNSNDFFVAYHLDSRNKIPTQKKGLNIIGGHDVDIADYPYQVSLSLFDEFYCSGFLVSENWVVTAGHCLEFVQERNLSVRIGSNSSEIGGEFISISDYIIHPDFQYTKPDFDIGLIKLSNNVSIANASPARLPVAGDSIEEGALVTITGWGNTGNVNVAKQLQGSTVSVINQKKCAKAYEGDPFTIVTDNMFCAGGDNQGVCNGDSGGPAAIDGVVVGIVSWGKDCGVLEYPGVFTKVANFRNWIKEETGI